MITVELETKEVDYLLSLLKEWRDYYPLLAANAQAYRAADQRRHQLVDRIWNKLTIPQ